MQKVTIRIQNRIMDGDEKEELSSSYEGTRQMVCGAERILFSMPAYEGAKEEARMLITIREKEIEIRKSGAVQSLMRFVPGERTKGHLRSPQGEHGFTLSVDSFAIKRGDKLKAEVSYGLDFGGVLLKYEMKMIITDI